MSEPLTYRIEFHGPFRVATGTSARGADTAVDRDNPLPATSLKGVMRDAAATRLGLDAVAIDQVFGSTTSPSAWSWTPGIVASELRTRTRVRIDSESGVVEPGALIVSEELWAEGNGSFQIIQRLRIDDPTRRDDQIAILNASAAAVHSLGADRQRGFGWVSIQPEPGPVDWDAVLERLAGLGGKG